MLKSIISGSRLMIPIEIAVLDPPWPDDLLCGDIGYESVVAGIAEWVLSEDINDGVDPATAAALVSAVASPKAETRAWIYSDRDYRTHLLEMLGMEAIVEFSPFTRRGLVIEPVFDFHQALSRDELLSDCFGVTVVQCSAGLLAAVGLPGTYLTPEDSFSRIGIVPYREWDSEVTGLLSYTQILASFELMVIPAGPHCTDCLFISSRLDRESLVGNLVRSVEQIGREAKYLGVVAGDDYQLLRRRGQSTRPERFL